MAKEMLINVSEGEECRIALVENGRLEELYMERTSSTSHVGNIYKGRVTNVEPSIQAAFIDFGLGRNGFLHISDLMPSYFGRNGDDFKESVGRKMARRDRPPIQRCLRRGDEIIVQIIKEGIGTKGPTLSTYLSIPGRILVMMPGMSKLGVSRKIEDDEERRRLRQILDSLKPPRECGFIIRTAGVGKPKADIEKDLTYLTRLWKNIDHKIKNVPPPVELYTEGDLVTRTVRDVFTSDVERIVVDNKDVADRISDFVKIANPKAKSILEFYEGAVPLFHEFGIEKEIELMYSRHVPLPSGGSLVIDSTEAIVAIDVNSGKFRDHNDAEMTAFKTDMEAADEIPRQLRLRDLGGVIICDFIDLRFERHRNELEQRLHENLQHDRAKTKMLRMSQFGIIEMTRQRMRPSLKRSIYFDCPHCKGAGLVKTPESMALDVMRRLAIAINDERVNRVELAVCADVSFYLQNKKRALVASLESRFAKRIVIRTDVTLGMDAMKLELFDAREGLVFLEELGMVPQAPVPSAAQGGQAAQGRPPRGGKPARGDGARGGAREGARGGDRGGADRNGDRGGDNNRQGEARKQGAQRDDRGGGRPNNRAPERAGGRDGGRDGARDGGRPGGREGRRDGGREGGRTGGRDGGRNDQRPRNEEQGRGGQHGPRDGDRRPEPAHPAARDIDRDESIDRDEPEDRFDLDTAEEAVEQREDHYLDEASGDASNNTIAPSPAPIDAAEAGASFSRDESGDADEADDVDRSDFEETSARSDEAPSRSDEVFTPSEEPLHSAVEDRVEQLDEPVMQVPAAVEAGNREEAPSSAPAGRTRGGRGRGRAAAKPPVEPAAATAAATAAAKPRSTPARGKKAPAVQVVAEKLVDGGDADGEAAPKKKTRRGSRGGRGKGKTVKAAKAPAAEAAADLPARPSPVAAPAQAHRAGSGDRHLVRDEPVLPQPIARPRTYRDLDHIPDDLD